MAVAKITKSFVETVRFSSKGQTTYFDTELKGFGLRVGSRSKAFIARRDIKGRPVTVTLGRYPVLTAQEARLEAKAALLMMQRGTNPNLDHRRREALSITLEQAINAYLGTRKLRETTRRDYTRARDTAFKDWLPRELESISQEMVATRHRRLGERHGEAWANLSMRFLRAMFNFTLREHPELPIQNPVHVLSSRKAWFKATRKTRTIPFHELPDWIEVVQNRCSQDACDFLLLGLLTGLRRNELCRLRWEDVDLGLFQFTVRETKNHKDHSLPMTAIIKEIFERRAGIQMRSPWVFPGRSNREHIKDPRSWVSEAVRETGIEFTIHDLRRTFATVAESISVPVYTLKRLLNHSTSDDVTFGYVNPSIQQLREQMGRISDQMQNFSKNILPFKTAT
ncbi:MAG: tyrosine-type recombinase/integrase [Gammaproteobacteria bacterium]|nr:tyrosine-type recombinase/integrase [Gammaproteobacteria bacterium]